MKDKVRREDARLRAEAYAPAPTDSRLLYGGIAVVLLLVALVAVGGFYSINVWQEPWIIVALVAVAAASGLALRLWQKRRHGRAHRSEYDLGATHREH